MPGSNPAGGRATEAGMAFQAAVTAQLLADLVSQRSLAGAFGLPDATPAQVRCETGDAVDDAVVDFTDGRRLYIQCKTTANLSPARDSALGRTLAQLVGLRFQLGVDGLDPDRVRMALVVSEAAPARLRELNAALRLFDHGGVWSVVLAEATEGKRRPLELFAAHVRQAWPTPEGPREGDLVALARIFRIAVLSEDAEGAAWRAAGENLGRDLFEDEAAGAAGLETLLSLSRRAIRSGASIDRSGALRALRTAGLSDRRAPGYDHDIAALVRYSDAERRRLRKHTVLPVDNDGVPIPRACLGPLAAAVASGSLLLTGEPGSGKTGVLLRLADTITSGPVVFLSVERFSGFTNRGEFRSELGLTRDPLDVLARWPGAEPGVLLVDALDASRGGPSEAVITAFIADAVERLGERWSVVASIRSFDLKNGRRFRDMMPGAPPDDHFADKELGETRHFHVERLSNSELDSLATAAPDLLQVVRRAPADLADVLRNVFNLSIAADLLRDGMDPAEIDELSSQSELLVAYEDRRLSELALQRAVKDVIRELISRRRLTVRATDVPNDNIEAVLRQGVLVKAGDKIAFAHHVLFDHLTARFFLDVDDPDALFRQLTSEAAGLLLAPAMRFAIELSWEQDDPGRPQSWRFLARLSAAGGRGEADPLLVSAALRSAVEMMAIPGDVSGLASLIDANADGVEVLISHLARYLALLVPKSPLKREEALAWSGLAALAAARGNAGMLDAARMLLFALTNSEQLEDPNVLDAFGAAARMLLEGCWALSEEVPRLANAAIRVVVRSYSAAPGLSRDLLEKILTPERLAAHAADEAPTLAEGIREIIPHDPKFAARIYAVLYGYEVDDVSPTWFGGNASRLLPLTSTPKQDFEHARWLLNRGLKPFLEEDAAEGTRAVIGAARGLVEDKGRYEAGESGAVEIATADGATVKVVGDLLTLLDWREEGDHRPQKADVFTTFVQFLRLAAPAGFAAAVAVARAEVTPASVWARILGVAAERDALAEEMIWPVASKPAFAVQRVISRDAAFFLAAAYPFQSMAAREAFEREALAAAEVLPEDWQRKWWPYTLARFLSLVSADALAMPEMRAERDRREAAEELRGNPPLMQMRVGWSGTDDVVDSLLQEQGADLERSPDREIRVASRAVEERLKGGRNDPVDAAALAALWADVENLVELLDAGADAAPHESLVHAAWGAVSNGGEWIASADSYTPGQGGHPPLDVLLALIGRLHTSPYPVADGTESGMAWGNWDVRVYAAASLVALAPRYAEHQPAILSGMADALNDPVPTVRLQVAQNLTVLWNAARNRMWELVDQLVAKEHHPGVTRFFLAGTIERLKAAEPVRVGALIDQFLQRAWDRSEGDDEGGENWATEIAAPQACWLYVVEEEPRSAAWLKCFAAEPARGAAYLVPCLNNLRSVFFFPYAAGVTAEQLAMSGRARQILDWILPPADALLNEARARVVGATDPAEVETWRPRFQAADQLIEEICEQLYFGSGAFRGSEDDEPALATPETKRRFLNDYASVLDRISAQAHSRSVHHLLELYAHLVEGDPEGVFRRLARLLMERGAADGYHFESLASDALVTLVRRYLADYREIFAEPELQAELVCVLKLFSDGGSQDAVELMFELPDLLR